MGDTLQLWQVAPRCLSIRPPWLAAPSALRFSYCNHTIMPNNSKWTSYIPNYKLSKSMPINVIKYSFMHVSDKLISFMPINGKIASFMIINKRLTVLCQ